MQYIYASPDKAHGQYNYKCIHVIQYTPLNDKARAKVLNYPYLTDDLHGQWSDV